MNPTSLAVALASLAMAAALFPIEMGVWITIAAIGALTIVFDGMWKL